MCVSWEGGAATKECYTIVGHCLKKYLVRSLWANILKLGRTESYNNYSLILSCIILKCLEYEVSKNHTQLLNHFSYVAKMSHMICMPSSGTRVNCGDPFNKYKVWVCHLCYPMSPFENIQKGLKCLIQNNLFYILYTFTTKWLFVSRGMDNPTESLSSKRRLFKFVHLLPTSPLIDISAAACSRAK